jgi:hypothetical protein
MKPKKSRGTTIGQGNLVEAKAMLRNAGNTIAASQRIVFHFNRFFLSEFFIGYVSRCWFGLLEICENTRELSQSCEVDHELVNSIGPDRHCLLDTFGEEDDWSRSSPSLTCSHDHFYRLGDQS